MRIDGINELSSGELEAHLAAGGRFEELSKKEQLETSYDLERAA